MHVGWKKPGALFAPLLAGLWLACLPAAEAGPLRDRIAARQAESHDIEQVDDSVYQPTLAGLQLTRDQPYGDDPAQVFDIYSPDTPRPPGGGASRPLIVMVHGGGWARGDKAARGVVENKVARWIPRDAVLVSINYRMLPQADPLTQMRDVARAVKAARGRAHEWGADGHRVVLMGHSAGAHLVALLAASPSTLVEAGGPVAGAVLLDSAAMDVARIMRGPHLPLYDRAFGDDPAYWRQASPSLALAKGAAPLLAVCSSRRRTACDQAERHAQRARTVGTRASVLPLDLSHADINRKLGLPGAYTDAVERFLAEIGVLR